MRTYILAAGAALTVLCCFPGAARAGGSAPVAVVSILEGRDFIGCGTQAFPCRTAQFAETFVVRPGGAIIMEDVGRFGAPDFFTALTIAAEKITGLPR